MNQLVKPVTDAEILELRELLPRDHYAWWWTVAALPPYGSRTARAMCARIIHALRAAGML